MQGLQNRLQQWLEYESQFDKIISWLTESEKTLKAFGNKSSLEEKKAQLDHFQVTCPLLRTGYDGVMIIPDTNSLYVRTFIGISARGGIVELSHTGIHRSRRPVGAGTPSQYTSRSSRVMTSAILFPISP